MGSARRRPSAARRDRVSTGAMHRGSLSSLRGGPRVRVALRAVGSRPAPVEPRRTRAPLPGGATHPGVWTIGAITPAAARRMQPTSRAQRARASAPEQLRDGCRRVGAIAHRRGLI